MAEKTHAKQTSKNLEKQELDDAAATKAETTAAQAVAEAAKKAQDELAAKFVETETNSLTGEPPEIDPSILGDDPPEALFAPKQPEAVSIQDAVDHRRKHPPGSFATDGKQFMFYGDDGQPHPYDGPMVEFVSRDPGLSIELGDVQVRFDMGRATVPAPLGERMQRHMLYGNGKFYLADEVAILGGKLVSYRENKDFRDKMVRARTGDGVMYATEINPNLAINFGDFRVQFQDGYLCLDKSLVERFERHVFFREQRIIRIDTV